LVANTPDVGHPSTIMKSVAPRWFTLLVAVALSLTASAALKTYSAEETAAE